MTVKILIAVCSTTLLAFTPQATADELDSTKIALDNVATHAKAWQYGWTGFFTGSLALQTRTLALPSSSAKQRFDAKVSLVTSTSGLLSVLFNPLDAAFLSDFENLPETTESERKMKAAFGREIWQKSQREVERRRSWSFQAFLVTEQLLAAGAIAWIDKRPEDAMRRFALGMITSELFVFTTPRFENFGAKAVSWQLSPHATAVTIRF